MLQEIFSAREVRVVEFYTSAATQDAGWTTHRRDIYHLNYYRSAWARATTSAARGLRDALRPDRG
jgi:hypothetical protein